MSSGAGLLRSIVAGSLEQAARWRRCAVDRARVGMPCGAQSARDHAAFWLADARATRERAERDGDWWPV